MERIKLFSKPSETKERIKLFSTPTPKRIKLFSEPEKEQVEENKKEVVCLDCGHKFLTAENVSKVFCPKCGGRYVVVADEISAPLYLEESCYSEAFSEYSGKVISEKKFSEVFPGLDMLDLEERGYGETCENGFKVASESSLCDKMFSKLTITVTKELDLDPAICCHGTCNHSGIIEEISPRLPEKSIVLLKKIHGLLPDSNEWVKDSRICDDIRCEFGGSSKDLGEFKNELEMRYPDAPEDVIEILKRHGVIKEDNNKIEILK